jgi:hypothetical protein
MHAMRTWMAVVLILGFAAAVAWASDAISLQGERTVYTVDCLQGQWQGATCGGTLAAGKRYRFRALRAHSEVVFWTVGATDEPSGKFTSCSIQDGRNWTCPPNADAPRTITLQMVRGTPVPDTSGRVKAFHALAKWRWWLVSSGLPIGHTADN